VDVKLFGPDHAYVTEPVLLVAELVRVKFDPLQIGLGVALADTADGTTLTVTVDVIAVVEPQALVAVTV